MTAQKLRLAALAARSRRMLRHTSDPVERTLALVVISRAIADDAALAASDRSGSNSLRYRAQNGCSPRRSSTFRGCAEPATTNQRGALARTAKGAPGRTTTLLFERVAR
jgi:hypothetical protein